LHGSTGFVGRLNQTGGGADGGGGGGVDGGGGEAVRDEPSESRQRRRQ
jgi:hypothetical protein